MSKPPEVAQRLGMIKGTQAQALGSVLIEPRTPVRHSAHQPEEEHEPQNLRELHDSLRFDPAAAEAERTADRILAEAQAQRESLLSDAAAAAEQARSKMEQEVAAMQQAAELELSAQRAEVIDGLRRELEQQFAERYAQALSQLEAAARRLADCQDAYLKEIEGPALALVLAVCRQLLGQELSRNPAFLAGLVADALAQLQPQPAAQLQLHPGTLKLLQTDDLLAGVLAERGLTLDRLELKPNPALHPDQFELQAGMALIGFDLEARAAELCAELEERAASGSAQSAGAGA